MLGSILAQFARLWTEYGDLNRNFINPSRSIWYTVGYELSKEPESSTFLTFLTQYARLWTEYGAFKLNFINPSHSIC